MIRLLFYMIVFIWLFFSCFPNRNDSQLKFNCLQTDSLIVMVNHTFQVDFSYSSDTLKIFDKIHLSEFKKIFENSDSGIRDEKSKIASIRIFNYCNGKEECFIIYIGLSHYARILQHTGCNTGGVKGNYSSYDLGEYLLRLFEENSINIQTK